MTGSPQTKAKTPAIPAQMEIRFKLSSTKTNPKPAPKTAPRTAPIKAWNNLNNITQTFYTTAAIVVSSMCFIWLQLSILHPSVSACSFRTPESSSLFFIASNSFLKLAIWPHEIIAKLTPVDPKQKPINPKTNPVVSMPKQWIDYGRGSSTAAQDEGQV